MPAPTWTDAPDATVFPQPIRLDAEERQRLGAHLADALGQARGHRETLDQALEHYAATYDMRTERSDWPWPGASNLVIPLTPSLLDTTVARMAQLVFVPRLYVARGTTPEAAQTQATVERYYNTEAWRLNWIEAQYQWMHLAARDGLAALEVRWEQRRRPLKQVRMVPQLDPETRSPMLNPVDGSPLRQRQVVEVLVSEYDNVRLTPVELRDIVTVPAWATDYESAQAVFRRVYPSPSDLRARVQAGVFDKDAVDRVLAWLPTGGDAVVGEEFQDTYSAGGKIDVSPVELADPSAQTGGVSVWQIHSRIFEHGSRHYPEMVYWLHEPTQTLLGAQPYAYWHGQRPFIPLAPMPRPNRLIGYAIPERLASLQQEMNALHNQRRNELDLRLSPPMYEKSTAEPKDQDKPWGPGARWVVTDRDDIGLIQFPEIPQSAWLEESSLQGFANRVIGLDDPLSGKAGASRRTKYEMQLVAASAGIRVELMAKRVQFAMKQVFWQIHQLKLQYGPDTESRDIVDYSGKPLRLEVSKADLAQDYELDINGAGTPLDRGSRRQDLLFLYSLLSRNPLVSSNLQHLYAITRSVLEEYERPDIQAIIGTMDEAQQLQQQMQAAQAQGGGAPAGGGGGPAGNGGSPAGRSPGRPGADGFG